jgi:hypothetical protein
MWGIFRSLDAYEQRRKEWEKERATVIMVRTGEIRCHRG